MKPILNVIKSIYALIPNEFLRPLEFMPFSFFCGRTYRAKYKELESDVFCNGSTEHYHRLYQFLNWAIVNVPYYRDVAKALEIENVSSLEDFERFPIISKEFVDQNFNRFIPINDDGKFYSVSTGGTTGKQLNFRMSNSMYGYEWAFVSSYLKKHGVDINSRRLCLRGVAGIPDNELLSYNHLYKEMLVSPFRISQTEIANNFDKIVHFKPFWIHGYPSSIAAFASNLDKLGLKIDSVKHILLVSEQLTKEQEKIISKVFRCPLLTFYGMTERVIFAPKHNDSLIPSPSYGYTEEIDGELIGTGFLNTSFPLIRYRTGDQAQVKKNDLGTVTEIVELEGRWGGNFLVGASDSKITMTSLNVHSDSLSFVERFQFVQSVKGECVLKIIPAKGFINGSELAICQEFQSKVGNEVLFSVRLVEDIPLTSRGKHIFIISDVM